MCMVIGTGFMGDVRQKLITKMDILHSKKKAVGGGRSKCNAYYGTNDCEKCALKWYKKVIMCI